MFKAFLETLELQEHLELLDQLASQDRLAVPELLVRLELLVFKDLKAFQERQVQPVFLEIKDYLVTVVHLVLTELLDLQVNSLL